MVSRPDTFVISKPLTYFPSIVEYRPIPMSSIFCYETKAKRKPISATPVVGFGLDLVKQEIDKVL